MARPKGICALCEEEKLLCNSHIIPKFCLKHLLDEKRQMVSIELNQKKKKRMVQDGFKEYLLCHECEQHLSEYEKAFEEQWFDLCFFNEEINVAQESYFFEGIDYKSFKLFHLSILWRFHKAKEHGKNIDLGSYYSEKIRKMLLEGNPGPDIHFPIAGMITVDKNNKPMRVAVEPIFTKEQNATWYATQYAGCTWVVIMTNHPSEYQKQYSEGLTENGDMKIYINSCKDSPSFRHIAGIIQKNFGSV